MGDRCLRADFDTPPLKAAYLKWEGGLTEARGQIMSESDRPFFCLWAIKTLQREEGGEGETRKEHMLCLRTCCSIILNARG